MRVISLGWGVQSFTLAAMVALGELEPIDAAIHADTTHDSVLYRIANNDRDFTGGSNRYTKIENLVQDAEAWSM